MGMLVRHRDRGHGALPLHRDRERSKGMGTQGMAKGQGCQCWHGMGTEHMAQMGTQGAGTAKGWHLRVLAWQGMGTGDIERIGDREQWQGMGTWHRTGDTG